MLSVPYEPRDAREIPAVLSALRIAKPGRGEKISNREENNKKIKRYDENQRSTEKKILA